MLILISAICVWLLGSAFGYGWSVGSLREEGSMVGGFSSTLWLAWPAYRLGYLCGQRYTARQLAPMRMKAKLAQEQQVQMFGPNPWSSITTNPNWITYTSSTVGGTGGNP